MSISEAAVTVVNKSVPEASYSAEDVRAIFTMHKRYWPNQHQIKVYILSDNHPTHKDFVKNTLNMFSHQIRRVWDRMTYSGTGTAPVEVDSELRMIEKIAGTPDAIGYLTSNPDNENIRSIK